MNKTQSAVTGSFTITQVYGSSSSNYSVITATVSTQGYMPASKMQNMIEASPEMLAALKIAERSIAISLDYWRREDQKRIEVRGTIDTLTVELSTIRAAIAKAEGRS